MRKILLTIIAALTLTGCLVEFEDNHQCQTPHSIEHEVVTASGVLIETVDEVYVTAEDAERIYKEVEACLGVPATPGPVVAFVSWDKIGRSGAGGGFYSPLEGKVYINTNADPEHGFYRDCSIDGEVLRHEFVHHLLYMNGLPHSHSGSDAAEWSVFADCGPGASYQN